MSSVLLPPSKLPAPFPLPHRFQPWVSDLDGSRKAQNGGVPPLHRAAPPFYIDHIAGHPSLAIKHGELARDAFLKEGSRRIAFWISGTLNEQFATIKITE